MSNPNLDHAYKSVRLKSQSYTEPGAYSVTLVTARRQCIFGRVENGRMIANEFGQIVLQEWLKSPVMRPMVELDTFCLMPNHFHGLIWIKDGLGCERVHGSATLQRNDGSVVHGSATLRRWNDRPAASIFSFVAGFKAATAKHINVPRGTPRVPVWQPSFHEHIIRSERDLLNHRQYILDNPEKWDSDKENPDKP